jgi:hypothetical protein
MLGDRPGDTMSEVDRVASQLPDRTRLEPLPGSRSFELIGQQIDDRNRPARRLSTRQHHDGGKQKADSHGRTSPGSPGLGGHPDL